MLQRAKPRCVIEAPQIFPFHTIARRNLEHLGDLLSARRPVNREERVRTSILLLCKSLRRRKVDTVDVVKLPLQRGRFGGGDGTFGVVEVAARNDIHNPRKSGRFGVGNWCCSWN